MGLIPRTPVSVQQWTTTHYARAASSSGTAVPSLNGGRPKTQLLAGSICGGVVFIAWFIGFTIYFRKRYKRKKLKRAAAKAGVPPPDVKSIPLTEKLVIPPDPAVFLGQARPGPVFEESTTKLVDKKEEEKGKDTDGGYFDSGGPGASGSGSSNEKGKPLLLVVAEEPDNSPTQQRQSTSQEEVDGTSGHGSR